MSDSQSESEEWEREYGEWERGEGSGESECSAPVGGDVHEEGDSTSSEEGAIEEEGGSEEEEEEEKDEDTPQETLMGDDDHTVTEGPAGVRDIPESERELVHEREALLRRVGHLPLPPHPYNTYILKPTTPVGTPSSPSPSSSSSRQWLLEVTLVLLVITLLLIVCSRLSNDWMVRVSSIRQEKPI